MRKLKRKDGIWIGKMDMDKDRKADYLKDLKGQMRKAKNIIIEKPSEIVEQMIGLEMWEFEVLVGDDAYCSNEEIFIDFQGKEMRIYIEDGKLSVYTD